MSARASLALTSIAMVLLGVVVCVVAIVHGTNPDRAPEGLSTESWAALWTRAQDAAKGAGSSW